MNLRAIFGILLFFAIFRGHPLPQRPRIYFHGLGVGCADLVSWKPHGFFAYDITKIHETDLTGKKLCVETGAFSRSATLSLEKQALAGCNELRRIIFNGKSIHPSFWYGFHLIGLSQGGLLVRLAHMNCPDLTPLIATLTFNGSPMLGITKFPSLSADDFKGKVPSKPMMKFIAKMIQGWCQFFLTRRKQGALQYLGSVTKRKASKGQPATETVNYAPLIRDLLADEKTSFTGLDRLNVIMYQKEMIINPRSSTGLGIDFGPDGEWQDFSESLLYSKYGLDRLWKDRRLIFALSAGMHVIPEVWETTEVDFLTEDDCYTDVDLSKTELVRAAYRSCLPDLLYQKFWTALKVQIFYKTRGVTLPKWINGNIIGSMWGLNFRESTEARGPEKENSEPNSPRLQSKRSEGSVATHESENFDEFGVDEFKSKQGGQFNPMDVAAHKESDTSIFSKMVHFEEPPARWNENLGMYEDWGSEGDFDDVEGKKESDAIEVLNRPEKVKI